jgi:hypothetical protein
MFILLVFDYRLENIKVHIRLVMCFHLLKLFPCCALISIMKYANFICSFILDIQGTAGEVWPWEGSRHSHHWGYFSYIHFLTYLMLLQPFICKVFLIHVLLPLLAWGLFTRACELVQILFFRLLLQPSNKINKKFKFW